MSQREPGRQSHCSDSEASVLDKPRSSADELVTLARQGMVSDLFADERPKARDVPFLQTALFEQLGAQSASDGNGNGDPTVEDPS